jgi:DNA-binding NarL/FixJ family response regulator
MIRILICDDQAIVRNGLTNLFKLEADLEVVGVARNGAEAIQMAARLTPDLVLMDLNMPGVNGIDATRAIRNQCPQTRILVLTTYDDDEWVFDAIHAGAAGYLLKDLPREKLLEAVRGTPDGKSYVDPVVNAKLLKQVAHSPIRPASALLSRLTEREGDILRLIAQGLNNADIAQQLFLSEGTVRNHVSAILAKLGVADRTQAALLAMRHGLTQP